jgi:hypothetical protein
MKVDRVGKGSAFDTFSKYVPYCFAFFVDLVVNLLYVQYALLLSPCNMFRTLIKIRMQSGMEEIAWRNKGQSAVFHVG